MSTTPISLVFLGCLPLAVVGAENPACQPETRNDWSNATNTHFSQLAQKGQVGQVLFLGDSITQLWSFPKDHKWPGGLEVWQKTFAPLKATNFGISGDTTGNLLWRITAGKQLDNIHPKVVVLLIGTNNLHRTGKPDTPAQVAEGVKTIVATIKAKLPETKLVLMGVLPRGWKADSPYRSKVKLINQELAKLNDGKSGFYLDITDKLLNPDGSTSVDVLRDELHLSPKGYQILADELLPLVRRLLDEQATPHSPQ